MEVLSPSTAEYDRGEKREHYQQIPSLREYLLIEQDARSVELYVRLADDRWQHTIHRAGDHVELASIAVRFTVDEIYDAAGVAR